MRIEDAIPDSASRRYQRARRDRPILAAPGRSAIRGLRPTAGQRQRVGWRVMLPLVAAAAGAFLGWGLYRAPLLTVTEVEVLGGNRLSTVQIREAAQVEGQSILAVDKEQVEAALKGLPWVKQARLQRQLPNRVVILLEERDPQAVWQVDGAAFLVDEEGVVLGTAEQAPHLPLITDRDKLPVQPGDRVPQEAIRLAVKLTEVLPQALGTKAKRFEYTRALDGGLVVVAATGQQARFGGEEDLAFKLASWKAILQEGEREGRKIQHVDLRFGSRPFFR